jgi:hypothetical protein
LGRVQRGLSCAEEASSGWGQGGAWDSARADPHRAPLAPSGHAPGCPDDRRHLRLCSSTATGLGAAHGGGRTHSRTFRFRATSGVSSNGLLRRRIEHDPRVVRGHAAPPSAFGSGRIERTGVLGASPLGLRSPDRDAGRLTDRPGPHLPSDSTARAAGTDPGQDRCSSIIAAGASRFRPEAAVGFEGRRAPEARRP